MKFNSPTTQTGRGRKQARTRPVPPPGTSASQWVNPHARGEFQASIAKVQYTAEEHVDGVLVQREMKSTPEGIAWFMSDL